MRWLASNWPGLISVQPNAGLPELVDGQTHYPLGAAELASWLERFVAEDGVNLIGGCCGTEHPAHRGAGRDAAQAGRPAPDAGCAQAIWVPVGRQPLRRGAAAAGERVSSPSASAATPTARRNGASCRRSSDWDGCVAMGREQVGEGSNALDICTAFVGRDEIAEMTEVITPLHRRR